MSENQIQPRGVAVPQEGGRVAVDGSSITGDGTSEHPLSATGAGGGVITNATLTGDGTIAVPLGINPGHVAIVADGSTITGDGTTGSPLISHSTGGTVHTNTTLTGDGSIGTPLGTIADKTAVLSDGTTIAGNGVTGTALHTVDGGTGVAVDGTTITGTGKTGAPLIAHSSIAVDESGSPVVAIANALNFTGSGVSVTDAGGGVAHIDIPGGGGGATVFTDATLTGDGSVGDPLGTVADKTAVLADGVTIAGNGVTGTPLHTVAGKTAVSADGTSIGGNGVSPLTLHTIAGGTAVATDGVTITGNGTTGSPLTTSGGGASGRTFDATLITFGGDNIGQPVSIVATAPSFGITSVSKASGESSLAAAECAGLMIVDAGGDVTVQYDGIVTLTTLQWGAIGAISGGGGGLTAGATYFVTTSGMIDKIAPSTLGSFSSRIGIGLDLTQMLLLLSAPQRVNTASALVRSNAIVTSEGFGSLGHSGAGRYQLPLLGSPPADTNCIVTVTLSTNFSVAVSVAASVASGVVDIFISTEPGGAGIDGDFYVVVNNNS